jgi:hypothetical protein
MRLSDGRILVAMGPDIRFYDKAGKFVSQSGGQGRGPGEFQYVLDVMALPGDTLLALDVRRQRTWFTPEGKYLRTEALDFGPLSSDGWMAEVAHLLPNGALLAEQHFNDRSHGERRVELYRPRMRFTRYDPGQKTIQPLVEAGGLRQMSTGDHSSGVQPYSPNGQTAIGADRVYAGDNDSMFIDVFTIDGKPSGRVRVAEREIPVTAADLANYRKWRLEFAGDNAQRRSEFELEWTKVPRPKRHPYWGRALVDKQNNLWISSPWDLSKPESWTVFDRNGRKLATLTMPPRFAVREVGTDYVLGIAKDEDDVESVRVYGLTRKTR